MAKVVLTNADTGLPADGVEWTSTRYAGKWLINVANYDTAAASQKIAITIDGKPAGKVAELIGGGGIDGNGFDAVQETPYLLLAGE